MRFLNLFSIHYSKSPSDSVERDNQSSDGSFNGPATKMASTREEIFFRLARGTIDGGAIVGIDGLSGTSDVELSMPVALLFFGRAMKIGYFRLNQRRRANRRGRSLT